METKPWYKSMTILASFVGISLMWAQSQGFITAEQVEVTRTLGSRALETAEAILAALTVWGLRRAISPIEGPKTSTLGAGALSLAVIGIAGCANYNGSLVAALAETHGADSEISMSECKAFEDLAAALVSGPDVAIRYMGRANELERISVIAQRHGLQCAEIMSREDVPLDVLSDIVESFNITWAAAGEATQP